MNAPLPLLTPTEARILGVLVEKEKTVPDTYPLTLNSLSSGCNQKTSRDPVMTLAESELQAALEPFTAGVLEGQVSAYRGTTPFVRWGNGAFLVLALIALIGARPRRQR